LAEAVFIFMDANGEGHHEDFMRAFFRLKVRDLGALLPHVAEVLERSQHEVTHSRSETIPQANDILLVSPCSF
jgi:nuclear pore complex protein Nup133